MDDIFLTPEQAGQMLNLSTYTVRAYARQGILPAHKVGRTWRFSQKDLDDWVQGQRYAVAPPQGASLVRDRRADVQAEASADTTDTPMSSDSSSQINERQKAVDTLRAIRARSAKGDVATLVRDSRRELLLRGDADHGRG